MNAARDNMDAATDSGDAAPDPSSAAPDRSGAAPDRSSAAPFHRMATLRPAWARWNRPLLTVLAAFAAYVLLASVLLVLTVLVLALLPGVNIALGVTSGDPASPLDVGLALAMGALWLPSGLIGVRIGGWRPPGTAWSVAARFRRELLTTTGTWVAFGAIAVTVLAVVAGALAGGAADPAAADPAGAEGGGLATGRQSPRWQLLAVVVVVLLLAPLQAAGLELTLRGVLLQAAGTWSRSPLLPIALATVVALIARDPRPAVMVPALALALAAAVLAWKSGGLELTFLLTAMVTIVSVVAAAVAAGAGAGAGAAAMVAASAAPGTSGAALGQVPPAAALAGGTTGAIGLLTLTALLVMVISRREGVGLLEPVTRPPAEPAPEPVPF